MLSFLPGPVKAVLGAIVVGLNTVFFSGPLFTISLLKLIVPVRGWQDLCRRVLTAIATTWISVNNFFIGLLTRTRWELEGFEGLDPEGCYMVISNHQSWVDIPVLQKAFNRRIPFLKFFLKQQLIWVPLLGLAWWALDFPFMKRYSRAAIARRPELRGRDLETTRRACEKYGKIPVSVMNFMEGTRFTVEKHRKSRSTYEHLLPPKAGGLAFVLSAMGARMRSLIDVTIVYPAGRPTVYDLFSGRIPVIKVFAERREIPEEMIEGDYQNDPDFRERFQAWVSDMWARKNDLMEAELAASPLP